MKNKKPIFFLLAANSISGVAQGISMIAIPWYFVSVIEMPAFFGALYASVTFFALFWGLFVGALIDRYNRKSIFLAVSVAGGIILLSSALSGFRAGEVHYILAAMVFGVTYLVYSIHYPNLYAFAQEITEPLHYGRITSLIEIQGQVTNMAAGAFAAVLLTGVEPVKFEIFGHTVFSGFSLKKWELQEIFLLDAITYFIALILIALIRYQRVSPREIETGSTRERVATGLRYLKNNPMVFIFGTASFSVFVTVLVIGFYLAPIYINNHLKGGAGVYAISDMFFAFGAVLSGFGIRRVFRNTNTVMAVIILSALTAGVYFFYITNRDILLFYLTMFLVGSGNAGIRIMRMTYLFNHVPNTVIGRAGSVFGVINVLLRLFLISVFTIPFFAAGNNVIYAFMIMGIFLLLSICALAVFYRKILSKEKPPGVFAISDGAGQAGKTQVKRLSKFHF